MNREVTLIVPGHDPIPVTPEIAVSLDRALKEFRRSAAVPRNLAGEIEAFLSEHTGSSLTVIARGIRARDTDVRRALNTDDRFTRSQEGSHGNRRGCTWNLARRATDAVPDAGTDTSVSPDDT